MNTLESPACARPVKAPALSDQSGGHKEVERRTSQGMVNQRPAPHATSPMVPSERQEYKFR